MRRSSQGRGQLQGPHPATHTPLGRAQHGASGAAAAAVHAGLESLLRVGANAQSLARAGRVAAPPPEGDPAQALEAAGDDVPRAQGTWCGGNGCKTGGGQQPPLVAQQQLPAQDRVDHGLLRPIGRTQTLMTSNSRTARCGPACRVVWQGCLLSWRPPMPILLPRVCAGSCGSLRTAERAISASDRKVLLSVCTFSLRPAPPSAGRSPEGAPVNAI
jgi:hypothetical protein